MSQPYGQWEFGVLRLANAEDGRRDLIDGEVRSDVDVPKIVRRMKRVLSKYFTEVVTLLVAERVLVSSLE